MTTHLIAAVWLAIPFGVTSFYGLGYGLGSVHWLSTGGLPVLPVLPGTVKGVENFVFAVPIYLEFAFPAIFLSVLAEILHAITILRK